MNLQKTLLFVLALTGCGSRAAQGPDPGGPMMPTMPTMMDETLPDLGLAAVDLARAPESCSATSPRASAPEVSVLPDAGEAPLVDVLKRAKSSIRVMVYEMGYGGIFDTLKAKAGAGVSVRVILDQGTTSNQKYYDALKAAGAEVLWSDPKFKYMHAKVLIVDGAEAVLSTGNYSLTYSIQRERNFVAHLVDAADVADLVELFDADWAKRAPSLPCTRLIVSPENSRQRIIDLLASAQSTLIIESMQFADTDVRNAVAARKKAGVDVRVLLAAPSWIDANQGAATFLGGLGVPVRYMSSPGVHVKAFVVDGVTAYLGSENFSYTSLTSNREVGLFVTDASSIKPVADTFERDWATATPF